ncbi:MAG TPA: hypothetical protein DCX95_01120 [Elusimicrobia bacterium]|nr:hypothetical protein [Elusimicrobiota bacterium]
MEKKHCYNMGKQWTDFVMKTDKPVRLIHTALYSVIVQRCNSLHWQEIFSLPTKKTMKAMPIKGRQHYKNALDDLIKWGFINPIKKPVNQYSDYLISLNLLDTLRTKQKNLPDTLSTKQTELVDTLSTKQTPLPDTLSTKQPSETPCFSGISDDAKLLLNVYKNKTLFDIFLKLYEVKENPEKLYPLFDKFSEAEQVNILKNLPYYILKHPDIKYRHFPGTYLKNKLWKKFIDPGEYFSLNGIGYHMPKPTPPK